MEAWADRTVQLRESARPRPVPIRNYTFEVGAMLCALHCGLDRTPQPGVFAYAFGNEIEVAYDHTQ